MKKLISILVLSVFLVPALFAASISSPAATVKLTTNEVITRDQLASEVEKYKAAGYSSVTDSDVLEAMINEIVFIQGAKRDGYYVDDRTLDSIYLSQKQNIEAQAGQSLTDKEFEDMVVSQYGSVDAYKDYLREQSIMNQYVPAMKADMVENVAQPTDRDITNWYRKNQTSIFSQGYMVRVSVITFARSSDEAVDKASLAKANEIYSKIENGTLTFEKAVQQYSEDTSSKSKGGDVGWLVDSDVSRQAVGDEFVDTVMELDVGEIKGVITTPSDYVIAKVTASEEAKILSLDDYVSPDSNMTVREYIRQGLLYQNSQYAFLNAYQSLIDDLKSQAKINRLIK